MSKIPFDGILEGLYKLRTRESAQLQTASESYDMEIHQKISMPNDQKLKTMVKRSIDQKLRLRNFDARHGRIGTGAVVNCHKGLNGVERGKGIWYQWKEKGKCSKGDQCSFPHESDDRAPKPTPKASEPQSSKTCEHHTSQRPFFTVIYMRACTRMAQVWVRIHSSHLMPHAHCVSLSLLRHLHLLLLPQRLLSDHFVLPSVRQLHLPGCGGHIPCATPLRTLAPWPRTSLPQNTR